MTNSQLRKRADQAPILRLSCRGSGIQRAVDRYGGEGDRPVRRLHAVIKSSRRSISSRRGHSSATSPNSAGRSGEPLSKATLYATLTALKRFFVWLAGQPGYKSRITYVDAEYFNLSAKDARIAKATRPARIPTLEQIRHVIRSMPATTDIEQRDRALIAFTILTGARDGAIASFKLRHIDVAEGKIDQDAREVRTKFSKSFVTTFFPVGDDIRAMMADWVNYLRQEKLWGLDDPLFPATKVAVGDSLRFEVVGTGPQALEQRRSDPNHFQASIFVSGAAVLQPT